MRIKERKWFLWRISAGSMAPWITEAPTHRRGRSTTILQRGTEFEQHVMRRTAAAKAFHEAEAKTMLRLALLARSRTIRNPHLGQAVYYFRRGKGSKRAGYLGPARVIAVEPPPGETQGSSVVWLSHAATLIRAAPEHLRAATPLETQVYDIMVQGSPQAPSIVPKEDHQRLGRHYLGIGTTTHGSRKT